LLVIFIITTTPVVNDLEVDLPTAAKRPKEPKSKLHYVTVGNNGKIFLDKGEVDLPALQAQMAALRVDDPDLNVVIRGSAHAKYQNVVGVMDMLQQANVLKVNLATEAFAEGKLERSK